MYTHQIYLDFCILSHALWNVVSLLVTNNVCIVFELVANHFYIRNCIVIAASQTTQRQQPPSQPPPASNELLLARGKRSHA